MDIHDEFKSFFNSYAEGKTNADDVKRFIESKCLFGRIIRSKDTDFTRFSEPWKKLSWVMDGEGLCSLLGKNGNEMLIHAGSQQEWINTKVKAGLDSTKCKLATWENILSLLQISYPELETLIASKHLDKYLNDLQTLQYEEINSKWKEGKEDIMKVYYAGREDERYLTSHRFSLLSLPSLADFRAFLLHEVGLGVLYDGKGYTITESGELGLREYYN